MPIRAEAATGPPLEGPARLEVGALVGRYVVLREIGSGAMSRVYAAHDPELDRQVALKLLRVESLTPQLRERGRERLMREAQALARLGHPNVVGVHDVQEHHGLIAVAMRYIDGVTLRAWLAEQARSPDQILDVFAQAASGLVAAHGEGLVHRDFKPENVMIDADARVYVVDFGLAKLAGPASSPLDGERVPSGEPSSEPADASAFAGTPAYMAPEQFADGTVDARSDQFAFFVALYEALHGHRPFAGETLAELVTNVTSGRMLAVPSAVRTPRWLSEAIAKGLSLDPLDRFGGLDDVLSLWRRRRRRSAAWWWIGAAAVGGLAATGAALAVDSPSVCAGSEAAIETVWGPGKRAEVVARFEALDVAYGQLALDNALPALDAYARAWVGAHTSNCEATHVRGVQPPNILDLRTACLDQRRQALAAAVDVLTGADAEVAQRAVDLAQGLPPLDACSDPPALTASVAAPADAEARRRADALRARLARVRALSYAGRYAEGVALAAEVAGDAEHAGYDPVTAEAMLWHGILLEKAGELAAAETTSTDAMWVAERAGHDAVAARALTELVYVVGKQPGRTDDALRWARHAEAKVERNGDELLRARLLNNRGTAFDGGARFDRAVEDYRVALEIRERRLGPRHVDTVAVRSNLGVALARVGEPKAARKEYERALADAQAVLGPDHPRTAIKMTNLAELLANQGEGLQALALSRAALAIFEQTFPPTHDTVRAALSNVAVAYSSLGDQQNTRRLTERFLELSRAAGDVGDVGLANFNLGALAWFADDNPLATQHLEAAIAAYEDVHGPDHIDVASPLVTLAEIAQDEQRWADGQPLLQRALNLQVNAGAGATLNAQETRLLLVAGALSLGRVADARRWVDEVLDTVAEDAAASHVAEIAWLALRTAQLEHRPDPRALALARRALVALPAEHEHRQHLADALRGAP